MRYEAATHDNEDLECGSCGKTVPALYPCYWDKDLQVGECCILHGDDVPLCAAAEGIAENSRSVSQFVDAIGEHMKGCFACGFKPIPPLAPITVKVAKFTAPEYLHLNEVA